MSVSAVSSASTYSFKLHKKSKATKVGVLFKTYEQGVKVAEISPGSLALNSSLRVGDKILSINGTKVVDMSAKETASVLRSTDGEVEIIAETTQASNKLGHSTESTPLIITTASNDSTASNTLSSTSSQEKKSWTWKDSFQDHCRVLVHWPLILAGPLFLSPKQLATIHLSMNSVNNCQISARLHGELGRMAGVENGDLIADEEDQTNDMFADFGYTFGKTNGFGKKVRKKYDVIVKSHGGFAGLCAEGVAYFMLWNSLAGNTISSFLDGTLRGNTKPGSSVLFEVLFVAYYGPLFVILSILSFFLKIFPEGVPSLISVFFTFFLTVIASVWIIPYAFLGILALPCITGTRSIMAGSAGGYLA